MKITSHSSNNTFLIGEKLAPLLIPQDILSLRGDLGAGKTVLTKGILNGFNYPKDEVLSPTFTILNIYKINKNLNIYHFDWYRIKEALELSNIGIKEFIFSNNISLIEWYNEEYLRLDTFIDIYFIISKNETREIEITFKGAFPKDRINKITKSLSTL